VTTMFGTRAMVIGNLPWNLEPKEPES
jgi:hypothetical protein